LHIALSSSTCIDVEGWIVLMVKSKASITRYAVDLFRLQGVDHEWYLYSMRDERDMMHVSCNLCGADDKELLFEKDGFRHVRCRHCSLIYVSPRLSDHFGQQEVFWSKQGARLPDSERMGAQDYRRSRRKALLAEVAVYREYRKTGYIMDIGCGFGGFLKAAKEQGWEHPVGIEIAPQAAHYTSRFFPVKRDITEEGPHRKGLFDVIRLHNVIEHLSDPKKMVHSVHEFLRVGGLLVVSTPNFDSISVAMCGSDARYIGGDDHVYLFTPETLCRLLEEAGFRMVAIETKGVHLTPKDHNGKLRSYFWKHLSNGGITYAERLLDLFIRHTRKGDRLTILAEKR
jgi:2-polyprenyl-3-methyl-5-hydroxy-6-metoxy-1,4-benzoquinol methylase